MTGSSSMNPKDFTMTSPSIHQCSWYGESTPNLLSGWNRARYVNRGLQTNTVDRKKNPDVMISCFLCFSVFPHIFPVISMFYPFWVLNSPQNSRCFSPPSGHHRACLERKTSSTGSKRSKQVRAMNKAFVGWWSWWLVQFIISVYDMHVYK